MIHIIVNLKSSTGKSVSVWKQVKAYLRNNGIDFKAYKTQYKDHALEIARELSKLPDKHVDIVIVGGDGTINEVINGITDFHKVSVGIIPAGSGNDFARGVKIGRNVKNNMDMIINNVESRNAIRCDLGRVSWGKNFSRLYGISSGIGMDAIVCKKASSSKIKNILNKYHLGSLTYMILTVVTLFTMDTAKAKITYTFDEDKKLLKNYNKLIFAASMNQMAEGGGVPMAPKAIYNDGMNDLCLAHGIRKLTALMFFPFLVFGKHEKLGCFDVRKFKTCDITLSRPMVLHTDGEYCGNVDKVSFSCEKAKLKILNKSFY